MEPILECRTPPSSPELSRLKTKRRCPFGESPQQNKIPAMEPSFMACHGASSWSQDSNDCAFQLLMNSQKNPTNEDRYLTSHATPTTISSHCWICQQQREAMPCAFCEHSVCEMCVRQCDRCFGVFCAFCSTINYENHEDRPLCLTCHHEASKRQRSRVSPLEPLQPSSVWSQGRQEGFAPVSV